MIRLRKPNVMEVKAAPDRINYIDMFEEKLSEFKDMFEEYRDYDVSGTPA